MPGHHYTIEELMLDDSFIDYCLSTGAGIPSRWRNIIRQNPGQQKTFEEAKRLVLALNGGLSRPEVNRQIEIVRRRIKARNDEQAEPVTEYGPSLSDAFVITDKGQIKRKFLKIGLYYAVIICIMITGASWWFIFKPAANSSDTPSQPAQAQNYHSPLGQRQKVTLPDGSFVILNSNSSIYIGTDFNKEKREIQLKGDAFFRVSKDAKRPFTVYTENIAATALGTEFYVHSKKDVEKTVQIDLLDGKVQMADIRNTKPGEIIILNPGESGKNKEGSGLKKGLFDSLHLRSWISGRIYFNETPVQKVVEQLENWYGIEIKVKKAKLKNKPINGDYKDEPLQNILDVICFSINSRYHFEDNMVIIE